MYMCDISFKAFYTGNVSMLASTRSFVSEVMHRRIWSGYVRTSMKYSCRSTQNSEEGRAHAAPRQTRKKPQRNNSKRKWENRSEYERWGEKKNTQNCIYSNKENIMCMQKAVLGKKKNGKWTVLCVMPCLFMKMHTDRYWLFWSCCGWYLKLSTYRAVAYYIKPTGDFTARLPVVSLGSFSAQACWLTCSCSGLEAATAPSWSFPSRHRKQPLLSVSEEMMMMMMRARRAWLLYAKHLQIWVRSRPNALVSFSLSNRRQPGFGGA